MATCRICSGATRASEQARVRTRRCGNRPGLLSDTKTAEYLAEQIVAGEFTGDLTQCVLSEPQVLGEQFEGPCGVQYVGGVLHMRPRALQRVDVPAPGGERSGLGLTVTDRGLQVNP